MRQIQKSVKVEQYICYNFIFVNFEIILISQDFSQICSSSGTLTLGYNIILNHNMMLLFEMIKVKN